MLVSSGFYWSPSDEPLVTLGTSTRPQVAGLRLVYAPKIERGLFRPLDRVTAKLAPRLVSLEVSQSQAGSNREKWRRSQAVGEWFPKG